MQARLSVCHSAIIFANAVMHKGTTVDAFLRENLEWLSRATNWAKFSATAGLGVIHSGHLAQVWAPPSLHARARSLLPCRRQCHNRKTPSHTFGGRGLPPTFWPGILPSDAPPAASRGSATTRRSGHLPACASASCSSGLPVTVVRRSGRVLRGSAAGDMDLASPRPVWFQRQAALLAPGGDDVACACARAGPAAPPREAAAGPPGERNRGWGGETAVEA